MNFTIFSAISGALTSSSTNNRSLRTWYPSRRSFFLTGVSPGVLAGRSSVFDLLVGVMHSSNDFANPFASGDCSALSKRRFNRRVSLVNVLTLTSSSCCWWAWSRLLWRRFLTPRCLYPFDAFLRTRPRSGCIVHDWSLHFRPSGHLGLRARITATFSLVCCFVTSCCYFIS